MVLTLVLIFFVGFDAEVEVGFEFVLVVVYSLLLILALNFFVSFSIHHYHTAHRPLSIV